VLFMVLLRGIGIAYVSLSHLAVKRRIQRLTERIAGKEGLKVMNRHHIHCASGLYGQEGVISGMRATCDLFIEIDVAKAMAGKKQ